MDPLKGTPSVIVAGVERATGLDELLAAITAGNALLGSIYDKLSQIEGILQRVDDNTMTAAKPAG